MNRSENLRRQGQAPGLLHAAFRRTQPQRGPGSPCPDREQPGGHQWHRPSTAPLRTMGARGNHRGRAHHTDPNPHLRLRQPHSSRCSVEDRARSSSGCNRNWTGPRPKSGKWTPWESPQWLCTASGTSSDAGHCRGTPRTSRKLSATRQLTLSIIDTGRRCQ